MTTDTAPLDQERALPAGETGSFGLRMGRDPPVVEGEQVSLNQLVHEPGTCTGDLKADSGHTPHSLDAQVGNRDFLGATNSTVRLGTAGRHCPPGTRGYCAKAPLGPDPALSKRGSSFSRPVYGFVEQQQGIAERTALEPGKRVRHSNQTA